MTWAKFRWTTNVLAAIVCAFLGIGFGAGAIYNCLTTFPGYGGVYAFLFSTIFSSVFIASAVMAALTAKAQYRQTFSDGASAQSPRQ